MTWFLIVSKLLKTLVELLHIAEKMFDDIPDSGAQKKAFVMQAVRSVVEGMSGVVLTDELWAKVETVSSLVIDAFCLFLFPHEAKK